MTTLGSGRVKCDTEDKVMWRVVLEIFVGMGELATGRVVDEFLNGGGERVFRVVGFVDACLAEDAGGAAGTLVEDVAEFLGDRVEGEGFADVGRWDGCREGAPGFAPVGGTVMGCTLCENERL